MARVKNERKNLSRIGGGREVLLDRDVDRRRAGRELGRGVVDDGARRDMDKLREAGIVVTEFAPAEKSALQTIFDGVNLEWAQDLDRRNKPGSAVRKEFVDALKEAQK